MEWTDGDKAIIREAVKDVVYPAIEESEKRMHGTIAASIHLHHAECAIKDRVQHLEVTVSAGKTETQKATDRANEAVVQTSEVEKRVQQAIGGWRALMVAGSILTGLVVVLEGLKQLGVIK